MNKPTYQKIQQASSIALVAITYITTIGFALMGFGLIIFSLFCWTLFHEEGLGVLTMILGCAILSMGSVIFIGKASKHGDALMRKYPIKAAS